MIKSEEGSSSRTSASGGAARLGGYTLSIVFLAIATLVVSFGSRTPEAKSILPVEDDFSVPSQAVSDTLTKVEREWASANAQGNGQLLRPIMSRDFVATDSIGTVRNGSAYVKALTCKKTPDASAAPSGLDIRIYGKMAVVIGQNKVGGHKERFTHVYQHYGSLWQMVASHATRLKS